MKFVKDFVIPVVVLTVICVVVSRGAGIYLSGYQTDY